jgi:hypothetical protein
MKAQRVLVPLDGVVERLRRAGVTRVETCVWYGPTAEAITEAAQTRDADLILAATTAVGARPAEVSHV